MVVGKQEATNPVTTVASVCVELTRIGSVDQYGLCIGYMQYKNLIKILPKG